MLKTVFFRILGHMGRVLSQAELLVHSTDLSFVRPSSSSTISMQVGDEIICVASLGEGKVA